MAEEKPVGDGQEGAWSTPSQEPREHIAEEADRIERLGRIRELVFGSLDGLLVPLGVVSAVAGGTSSSRAVIVAGIAEAFAGALSMGAGEFISGRSEAQVQRTEVLKEQRAIAQNPRAELEEMVLLLEREGVAKEDASRIAAALERYPHAYEKTMVEKELGLQIEQNTVKIPEAVTMSLSYFAGSFFPLIAYFIWPVRQALPISIALTILALVIVGIVKGRLASLNLVTSAAEVVIVGGVSAGGGYLLGVIIPHFFGF